MPYKDPKTQTKAQAAHYQAHKKAYLVASQRSFKRKEAKLAELKKEPCLDCGMSYPPQVMGFHHRNPKQKIDNVARLMRNRGWATVLSEIEKCDLLCANCHVLRHINEAL